MNELIHIQNTDISIKEYKGQRVVTFKDIDMVHERPDGTARVTFNRNKEHFIEGEDYFVCDTYEAKNIGITAPNGTTLLTEQGYLMLVKPFGDNLSWNVQKKLVSSYFKVRKIATDELSPQTQLILQLAQSIASKELEDKERDNRIALANEAARKAVETTENIKEAVKPVFDNWREEMNKKIKRIQHRSGIDFQVLNNQMYSELERRAGCDIGKRLRNLQQRMFNAGKTKTEINNTRKIDVIESDKKIREIFSKIVSEYEIKYCS